MKTHLLLAATAALLPPAAATAQTLADPRHGLLELVTPSPAEQAKLDAIDGLAFDAAGNLFGTLELAGSAGAVVFVDKRTGSVTPLVTGVPRADHIAFDPSSGDFWVTGEVTPASTTGRIFRIQVAHSAGVPTAATRTSLTTSIGIDNPEGLWRIAEANAYGGAGDLLVVEDRNPGRFLRVDPATGTTSVLGGGYARGEGLTYGDFAGALPPSVYVAETTNDRVLAIAPSGAAVAFGDAAAVGADAPDNVRFGPDGFLYVTEDRPAPSSRVLRIAPGGTWSVFATGFGQVQGMAFDANGDLYVAEQDLDRIWRVRFALDTPAFCDASDGSLASCPCTNPGDPDTGCDVAQGTGGVSLAAIAQTTSPSPSATLLGAGFPPAAAPTVVAVRSGALDPAAPVVFGDGLRCLAIPSLVRLATRVASGGSVVVPVAHGAGPGVFSYQLWFRNTPQSFCDASAAFNWSAGRQLSW